MKRLLLASFALALWANTASAQDCGWYGYSPGYGGYYGFTVYYPDGHHSGFHYGYHDGWHSGFHYGEYDTPYGNYTGWHAGTHYGGHTSWHFGHHYGAPYERYDPWGWSR